MIPMKDDDYCLFFEIISLFFTPKTGFGRVDMLQNQPTNQPINLFSGFLMYLHESVYL